MSVQYDIGSVSKGSSSLVEFVWKIEDFFSLPQDVGHVITSPEFHFAGAKWHLAMWPKGTEEIAGWTELWLMNTDSRGPNIQVQWELGIRSDVGFTFKSVSGKQNLKGNFTKCGEIKLMPHSELVEMRNVVTREGVLTAFCELRLEEDTRVATSSQTEPRWSAEKLMKDFKGLLLSGDGADVIIKVKDEQYKAHKTILGARIPVRMFEHQMLEKITCVVVIEDCEPEIFWEFLHYVYTGSLQQLTVENVFDLYIVADRYLVDELKLDCEDFMGSNLSVDNFCDVLSVALQHRRTGLLEQTTNFFYSNMTEILNSVKWQIFQSKNPTVSNELHIKARGLLKEMDE